jgi:hypothetical protein
MYYRNLPGQFISAELDRQFGILEMAGREVCTAGLQQAPNCGVSFQEVKALKNV